MIRCLLKYFLIFLVASNFTQKSGAVSTPAKSTITASPQTIMSSSTAEPFSLSSTNSSTTSSSAVPSETSPSSSISPTTNTITTSSASMPSEASTFSSMNETIAPTLKTYPNNLAGITIFSCLIFIAACALIAIFVLSHLKKRGRQAFDQEKAMDNTQVVKIKVFVTSRHSTCLKLTRRRCHVALR
uniref:Uncharacterized protein n=1 Tax=Acrobeloides nanus TaxID=290746 RepID=A0A914BX97_9BILA